jgi:putative transposase
MRIRSLSHCHYQHEYHIVWGTKYRRKILKPYVKEVFLEALFEVLKKYPKLHLVAVNTDRDHVHLQIEIAPDISVSLAMKMIKGHTSVFLKKRFPFLRRIYLDEGVWSAGYFSSTIGLNDELVRRYIAHQGRVDKPRTLKLGFS